MPQPLVAAPTTDEIEREIIGSILRDPSLYDDVRQLAPEDFRNDFCANVWIHIKQVASQGHPITPKTVAAGAFDIEMTDLRRLADDATANVDALRAAAQRLSSERRRERAVALMRDTVYSVEQNPDLWEPAVDSLLRDLNSSSHSQRAVPASETRERLARRLLAGARSARVPTLLDAIDTATGGGLPAPSLTMIAGFGKVGKTTLTATISYNLEQQQIPHVVFSLERRDDDIEALKVARELNINSRDLGLSVQTLPPASRPRYCEYVHGTRLTADMIRHEILYQTRVKGARAALIDYWQLIEGRLPREPDHVFLARVAQIIQKTSVDANIPIIMMYQLGEGPEAREIRAARTAANLCLIIMRDRGDPNTWLQTVATNISSEENLGGVGCPTLILNRDVGPHFHNPDAKTGASYILPSRP